jgi:hypothetical protein
MTHPEQPDKPHQATSDLAARTAKYTLDVEKVVRAVGEHPQYELKRSCSMKDLKDRIEFVKDIQSIATSRIEYEKFLIIGADAGTKSFVPVQNVNEFDEASVRQLFEKYLNPVPEFELFQLQTSDGSPFVVFVIPKQKNRRILARVTVEEPNDPKRKILIREGDLWTKGTSTGKRLAKPDDWDEIYEDIVESEVERRTRQRTAHELDLAVAREKLRPFVGEFSLPGYFTDNEFQALMEDLCGTQNKSKLKVLLERLRDDLVEGWHSIGAYEGAPLLTAIAQESRAPSKDHIRDHIKNVFRPAMHWLTLAGIYIVKNSGPVPFLDAVGDLLQEVFESSHRLVALRRLVPYGEGVASVDDHVSHTVPALESLTSLHLIGGYLAKRRRFEYLTSLFRSDVYTVTLTGNVEEKKRLMAFWPLGTGQGEPTDIRFRAGRINFCVARIATDSAYLKLFGSAGAATEALCQYEYCLELNSFMAFPGLGTNESAQYLERMYPHLNFYFWPSFIAFPFEYVYSLFSTVFAEITERKPQLLKLILFDPSLAGFLVKPDGVQAFLRFLDALANEQVGLFFEQRRIPPHIFWPRDIQKALTEFRKSSKPK